MSTPAPPPPQTQPPETQTSETKTTQSSGWTVGGIVYLSLSIISIAVVNFGAARISYHKYRSIGWAILAFIFAPLYYPFYGLFLSTPMQVPMIAGRRMKW